MSKTKQVAYDVVVIGGGLAGVSAAIAAAREGASTALVQERPVLGGNSSSEVRVTPHGAGRFHAYGRETGIITELACEDRAHNHEQFHNNGWTNSVWDLTLYDWAERTEGLDVYLNTTIQQVHMDTERRIKSVSGHVLGAEIELHVAGQIFIDCTGDGTIAALAGNEWRMGSEGREEFGEPHAPEVASADLMGSSIHFRARDTGRPAPYHPPKWAMVYEDADFFYQHNRKPHDIRAGYWWFELGSPWDTITDAETIRHELTRHVLGVWDWIKNKDPQTKERAANYALDWIGQVPGKRESRRIMGRYLLTEHDVQSGKKFEDEVAFGGWYLDLHIPGGLLAPTSELPGAAELVSPYGIPLRILIARDVDNLMMAGRNVSVTHAALGTVRVMSTTALLGQAAGTAAAIAWRQGMAIADVPALAVGDVQQTLLRRGCFLPHARNQDPDDLARSALVSASSEAELHALPPGESTEPLAIRQSQWIAVRSRLQQIDVWLSNPTDEVQHVCAALYPTAHIWDYDVRAETSPVGCLASGYLQVPARHSGWVTWSIDWSPAPAVPEAAATHGYVRLDLSAGGPLLWHHAAELGPGLPSASEQEAGRLRSHEDGRSLSIRVWPPQPVYGATQVINGTTRPYRDTNLWRSAPGQSLPQWLELEWPVAQRIRTVELTFPGFLLQDHNRYPAYFREPDCPRDYTIAWWDGKDWQTALEVAGNYQRHVAHALPEPVESTRLRVVVQATNGGREAAIYEIRCYGI